MSARRPVDPSRIPEKKLAALLEEADNAWLGLGDTRKILVKNPFFEKSQEDIERPHEHLLRLICNPDYFGFTCKHILNRTLYPFQLAILKELWVRPFPMLVGSRGCSKSFTLAIYAILRAILHQGSRVVIVGNAFRQSKAVLEYAEQVWADAPVLRDLVGPGTRKRPNGPIHDADRWVLRIGESAIVALPMGTGEKLRGQRATHLIVDEYSSINEEVFETVVLGFAAVSASPVEKARQIARYRRLQEYGLAPEGDIHNFRSNQTVLSGTAYYQFNHFYKNWKKYKDIIEGKGEPPEGLAPKDFSIIRLPVEVLPEGFMDEKTIARAKATVSSGVYALEYSSVFTADSNGFYKRSLIERCVSGRDDNPIHHPSCGVVKFSALLRGLPGRRYAMGVDPASEVDNFSIVISEIWPDHRRIVHCWTTTRSGFKNKADKGISADKDFYRYVARKIRALHKAFPSLLIALDGQGGGVSVLEALEDTTTLEPGERPILPVIDPEDPKRTDDIPGEHIIHVVQFARSDWVSEANHGMRKDFEDRALLFPEFDPLVLGLALEEDKQMGRTGDSRLYDTLEDCMMEIEELKDELATIVHSQTGISGRDRWDTPEVKMPGGKKGRLRKDRYSALLMANAEARLLDRLPKEIPYEGVGRFAQGSPTGGKGGPGWIGPQWYMEKVNTCKGYGTVVNRGHRGR